MSTSLILGSLLVMSNTQEEFPSTSIVLAGLLRMHLIAPVMAPMWLVRWAE